MNVTDIFTVMLTVHVLTELLNSHPDKHHTHSSKAPLTLDLQSFQSHLMAFLGGRSVSVVMAMVEVS